MSRSYKVYEYRWVDPPVPDGAEVVTELGDYPRRALCQAAVDAYRSTGDPDDARRADAMEPYIWKEGRILIRVQTQELKLP